MIKLKETDGHVKAIAKAGADYVKVTYHIDVAKELIADGKPCKSPFPCYPIGIDDELFFEGEEQKGE